MAGQPEVLQGHSFARRTVLASPQDELALTVGDTDTFAELEAEEAEVTATRETLVASSTATRETLSS
jgi:hypothetical protein